MASKLNYLVGRCMSIGLAHPTERTVSVIVAVVTCNVDAGAFTSELLSCVRDFKMTLRSAASRTPLPHDVPKEYPENPLELEATHPLIYRSAYVDGKPVCGYTKYSSHEWSGLIARVPCRSTRSGCSTSQPAVRHGAATNQQTNLLCNLMMKFQQMQQNPFNLTLIPPAARCTPQAEGSSDFRRILTFADTQSTISSESSKLSSMPPTPRPLLALPPPPVMPTTPQPLLALPPPTAETGIHTTTAVATPTPGSTRPSLDHLVSEMQNHLRSSGKSSGKKKKKPARKGVAGSKVCAISRPAAPMKRPAAAQVREIGRLGCSKCRWSTKGCAKCMARNAGA